MCEESMVTENGRIAVTRLDPGCEMMETWHYKTCFEAVRRLLRALDANELRCIAADCDVQLEVVEETSPASPS